MLHFTHQTRACGDVTLLGENYLHSFFCELLKKAHDGAGNLVNVYEVASKMAMRAVPLQMLFKIFVLPFGSFVFKLEKSCLSFCVLNGL